MNRLYQLLIFFHVFILLPSVATAQCYQNGLPCGTQGTPAGTALPTPGTLIMGTDTSTTIPILTDGNGRIVTNIYSLPALPTGANTIGSVNVNGTVPVSQSGTWTVSLSGLPSLAAGSNTIGSIANTGFNITGSLPGFAATPTFNIGTAPTLTTNMQGAVTTAAPSYTNGATNSLSLTTTGALRVDGSGSTQPVSGTVTANIGTTNGLALDSSVTAVKTALGTPFQANGSIANTSFGATQSGSWNIGLNAGTNSIGLATMQGSVTTAAPSYTTGTTQSLSLNTSGALRVDTSGATQTVGGTVNIGTAPNLNVVNLAGSASIGTVGLNAGTNAIGTVGVTALPALPAGANAIGTVGVTSLPALPAGTAIIGNELRTIAFAESTATLTSNATVTAGSHDAGALSAANPYNFFSCFVYSDQAGAITLSASNDNTTFFPMVKSQATNASVPSLVTARIVARYFRCSYTNTAASTETILFLNSQFGQ